MEVLICLKFRYFATVFQQHTILKLPNMFVIKLMTCAYFFPFFFKKQIYFNKSSHALAKYDYCIKIRWA